MSFILKDRVKETSNTSGIGPIVLNGAFTGFQPFSVVGDRAIAPYVMEQQGGAAWEVGVGRYIESNNSIIRTSILASSNANSIVDFPGGNKTVFLSVPSGTIPLTVKDLTQFQQTNTNAFRGLISNTTGVGDLVFSVSPQFITPDIGYATGSSLTLSHNLEVNSTIFVNNTATFQKDVHVYGDMYVSGNSTVLESRVVQIKDPMIYLAEDNPSDFYDIGFVGSITVDHDYFHLGLARDASDGVWKLFSGAAEPGDTIDFSGCRYDPLLVGSVTANTFTGSLFGNANTVTNGVYTTDSGTVTNTMLANSTISGVELGSNLKTLIIGSGLTGANYNGSNSTTINLDTTYVTLDAVIANGNTTANSITVGGLSIAGLYSFPTTNGSNNQILVTDGNGVLSWATSTSGSSSITLRDYKKYIYNISSNTSIISGPDIHSNTLDYLSTGVDVYVNGIRLVQDEDYFANTGTTIILSSNTSNTDVVEVLSYGVAYLNDGVIGISNTLSSNTANQVIDTFRTVDYTTAKYLCQIKSPLQILATELLLVTDGSQVYLSEYGIVPSGISLGDFGADILSGYVRLLFSPSQENTIIKVKRITVTS